MTEARVGTAGRLAARPDWSTAAWGGLALLAGLVLPWSREGRELWALQRETLGIAVISARPAVAVAVALAAAAAVVGALPWQQARRGPVILGVGLAGALAAVLAIVGSGQPLGTGAIAVLLVHTAIVGAGLSGTGLVRADPFTCTAILWTALFVTVFILMPLAAMLQATVVVKGRITADAFVQTVRSPGYLLIDRATTPFSETALALRAGLAAGGVAAALAAWRSRSARATGIWGLGAAGAGFLLALLYLGFGAVRNSILLAVIVGAASTALGFLFALLAERSRLSARRLLGPLSILPIITPPFVLGLAMIYMFGQRGFITYRLLGLSTNVFFGPLGVAVAQVLAFTPIAYLVLRGAVRALNVAVEEAAETLGASRGQVFRMVIWPLVRPGIANAFLLGAIESLADFGNPLLLGGGQRYLATEIFYAIVGRFNLNEAAVYGVTLLTMTLTIFLVQRRWIGERGYVTITGRPAAAAARPLPASLDYGGTAIIVVWIVLTLALYGSVFVGSVTKLWGFDYTPTLEHLRALSPQGWEVFWTSARLSAVAAVPSTLLGFLIAYLVTRVEFPGRSALEFAAMLSFAVPGTVMGIGYILIFNTGALLLTGTELIIVLAFVFRNMPVGIRAGVAAIHQLDRSVEEAAHLLGAGTASTLRRIVVPLLRPALLSGLIFAFVNGMTAVSQVIFLISPQHNLATVQILSHVEYGRLGTGAALASLLIIVMAGVVLALYLVTNRMDVGVAGEVAVR